MNTCDAQCPAHSGERRCYLIADHDIPIHIDISSGWPQPWSLPTHGWRNVLTVPADPLQDAPEGLR